MKLLALIKSSVYKTSYEKVVIFKLYFLHCVRVKRK